MELFLCLDCHEGGEDELDIRVITDVVIVVALDLFGYVVDELGEEGDLGEFVEGDELQAGQGVTVDSIRWRAVGKAALCG